VIHELKAQDFKLAGQVYEGLSYNLVIQSVIDNNTNGRIFVDNPANARRAVLWNQQDALLLEGIPYDSDFNESMAEVITQQIIPNAAQHHIPALSLHYFPETWEKTIQNMLRAYNPEKILRNLYWFRALEINWRRKIPMGFNMCRIDAALLEQTHLQHMDEVHGWIDSFWHSKADFLAKGIGYCLMHGDKIVSWCLSVYAGTKNLELGLATIPEFRNHGYATLTSAACVEYCIEHRIIPHWHCYKSNAASIAVAEKLGFEKVMEYPVYYFKINPQPLLISNKEENDGRDDAK
jgi:RimJ/RimL family protein N-acetyltransferase